MTLKANLEKAYDKMNWSFVRFVLLAFGFHQRWIKQVMLCFSLVSMNVMLNGSLFQSFHPKRGLRQGDPISLYLFILCMDVLSRLINSKVESGFIKCFSMARGIPPLHHVLFAGDVFLFGKATGMEATQFKDCLDTFCSQSRQNFNSHKSNILFSRNTRRDMEVWLTNILQFERIPILSSYLGLPQFRSKKISDYSFLLDKLDKKLAGQKSKLLSKASSLVLIKTVGLAIPIYAMQSISLPKTICERMDSRIRKFWWGARNDDSWPLCLWTWESICTPKTCGGLGYQKSIDTNRALLAKWCWSLLFGHSSLYLSILRGKYLRNNSFLMSSVHPSDFLFWKGILSIEPLVLRGACIQVRDGVRVDFWIHPWVPNHPTFRPVPICPRSTGSMVVSNLLKLNGGQLECC